MERNGILRDFVRYVSLNILGQAAYACYTMADTFLVSASLGADGLTALNLAFPVFCLISGTGLMLGIGGGTRYAILTSRGEREAADRSFTGAVCLAAACALVCVLLGAFCSVPIARHLGSDDAILPLTNVYLRTLLLFAPAFLANHLLQSFVRNDGAPALAMAALIAASVSDVALACLFIFRFGMGILGAVLAAGLAPVVGVAVMSPYLIRRKNRFHLTRQLPRAAELRAILATGVPSFLTEASSGVVMFVFNFLLLRLAGNVAVAAFSVITVISLAVIAVYTGLSQGIQPILSRSCGAGEDGEVRAILRYALVTVLLLSAVICSVLFFGTEQVVAVFNSEGNEALRAIAVPGMRIYFTACPFIGFNIVLATYFLSTERPAPAQAVALSRGLLVLVPMALLLARTLGVTGVWCSYPATECVVALLALALLRRFGGTPAQRPAGC